MATTRVKWKDPWGNWQQTEVGGLANVDAARARSLEEQRQALLKYQMEQINKQFDGANSDFLQQVEKNYLDYYTPQVDKQYENSRRELIYNLADRGLTSSSVANEASGDIVQQRQEALGEIGNQAKNRSQAARADLEGIRARVGAEAQAASKAWRPNPSAVSGERVWNQDGIYTDEDLAIGGELAVAAADSASAQAGYEPIGDLFAQPVASRGFNTSVAPVAPVASVSRPTLFNNNTRGGRGSSRVIR